MGFPLRRWLADRLPAGLSSGERLVALEIADWASDETGIAYGKDLLAVVTRRAGYANVKQTRKVLTKLGASGLELRVPIGKNQHGDPVYAHEGKQTTYRIPTSEELGFDETTTAGLPKMQEDPRRGALSTRVGPPAEMSGPPVGDKRAPAGVQEGPPVGAPSPHASSSTPQRSLSQATSPDSLLAALGVEEREREVLIHKIEAMNNVQNLGWWITASRNGTLADRVENARTDRSRYDKPRANNNSGSGWNGPYLNPTDPATAYAGYRQDITDEELAAVANAAPL